MVFNNHLTLPYLREWKIELDYESEAKKMSKNYSPSLTKAIIRAFGFEICVQGIYCAFIEFGIKILQPLLMSWFVRYYIELFRNIYFRY